MSSKFLHHASTAYAAIALSALLSAASTLPAYASGGGRFEAGYTSLLRQDHERAISRFTDAVETGELRPKYLALAYHYRGAEYLKTGRNDEAIDDLNRALAIDPSLATAYNDRAIAFRRKGDFNRAFADYDEAIRLMPTVYSFYLNRGLAYAANHQYDEAIANNGVALSHKHNCIFAMVAMGDAQMQMGRNSEALVAYQKAMRQKGDVLKVYPWVAAKLVALGAPPTEGSVTVANAKIEPVTTVIGMPPVPKVTAGITPMSTMIVLGEVP